MTAARKLPPAPTAPRPAGPPERCPAVTFVVVGPPQAKPRARVGFGGHRFHKRGYEQWRELVRDEAGVVFAELADRGTPWDAHAPSYAIGCRFFLARRDGGDLDNLLGGVLDALNKFAWPDDKLVVDVLRLSKRVDKERPRVEVEIRAGGPVDWTAADERRSRRACSEAEARVAASVAAGGPADDEEDDVVFSAGVFSARGEGG